jgi:hypothetical protein
MPPDTVYVGRPTKWGNPYRVGRHLTRAEAVARYRAYLLAEGYPLLDALHEIRGKNLGCWCPLDQPCHADVLLELANEPRGRATRAKSGAGRKGGAKR